MIPSTTALRALRQTLRQLSISPISNPSSTAATFASPINQVRFASILANLQDIRTQHTNKKRVGRGPSSGKGKTSGRGHKGQGQRGGHRPKNFEGGQTPQSIVNPVKGFKNPLVKHFTPLNLGTLQLWINQGRIDPSKPITLKELYDSRAVHGVKDGVKLLARDVEEFTAKVEIEVNKASRQAIEKIESLGGKVTTKFYTREGIRFITRPHLFPDGHRLAGPTSRADIEYYRDPAHRGYLTHLVRPGETPSLFWGRKPQPKKPTAEKQVPTVKKSAAELEVQKKKKELRKAQSENRVF
ncbi:YmL10 [Arthrobotrys musiformis]|uniref:YmL10 n=1 Tax=Arthrobotrys musiformis TaxID=47236 RepID=A0AAV9WPG7_9PEZI